MKIHLVKGLDNKFSVCYPSDYDKIKKIKPNETIEFEYRKKRNIKFHNKLFALLNLVYQNQEHYNNIDHLRTDLTIAAGFYEKRYSVHGEEVIEPKSISFASMDEFEFGEYYNRIIDQIVKYFHFDRQDILENIEQHF